MDFEQVFAQTEYCLIIKTTNSIRYRRNFSKSKNSAQWNLNLWEFSVGKASHILVDVSCAYANVTDYASVWNLLAVFPALAFILSCKTRMKKLWHHLFAKWTKNFFLEAESVNGTHEDFLRVWKTSSLHVRKSFHENRKYMPNVGITFSLLNENLFMKIDRVNRTLT